MYELQDASTSAPIFVGGEHRSGATLLAAILDSHARIVFGLELDFLEPADLGPHLLNACGARTPGKRLPWRTARHWPSSTGACNSSDSATASAYALPLSSPWCAA